MRENQTKQFPVNVDNKYEASTYQEKKPGQTSAVGNTSQQNGQNTAEAYIALSVAGSALRLAAASNRNDHHHTTHGQPDLSLLGWALQSAADGVSFGAQYLLGANYDNLAEATGAKYLYSNIAGNTETSIDTATFTADGATNIASQIVDGAQDVTRSAADLTNQVINSAPDIARDAADLASQVAGNAQNLAGETANIASNLSGVGVEAMQMSREAVNTVADNAEEAGECCETLCSVLDAEQCCESFCSVLEVAGACCAALGSCC